MDDDKKWEIEAFKGFVHFGSSSAFSGMMYLSLRWRHPREYERLLVEKNDGERMLGFRSGEATSA